MDSEVVRITVRYPDASRAKVRNFAPSRAKQIQIHLFVTEGANLGGTTNHLYSLSYTATQLADRRENYTLAIVFRNVNIQVLFSAQVRYRGIPVQKSAYRKLVLFGQ
jgi:hypothetical protein